MSNELLAAYGNEIDPKRNLVFTIEDLIASHKRLRSAGIDAQQDRSRAYSDVYNKSMEAYANREMIDLQELRHMTLQEIAEMLK